jgi:hypothetical protein
MSALTVFSIVKKSLLELINPNNAVLDKMMYGGAVGWRVRCPKESTNPEEPTSPLMEAAHQQSELQTDESKLNQVSRDLSVHYCSTRPNRNAKVIRSLILLLTMFWLCLLMLGTTNLNMDTLTIVETVIPFLDDLLQRVFGLLPNAYLISSMLF